MTYNVFGAWDVKPCTTTTSTYLNYPISVMLLILFYVGFTE